MQAVPNYATSGVPGRFQATVTAFANNLKTIRGYDAATGRLTGPFGRH
jgi:hypothetical protein